MMGFLPTNKKGKLKEVKVFVPKETCWETEIDMISDCSKAPETIDIFINPLSKDKIEYLMEKFKNIEWLAYLVGEDTTITDIYIPKQHVSAGSVTDIDSSICNRMPIIGVIHSHHGMGNGFSGTDDNWINQNNDISLCISNEGINGQMRWKTPCGSLKIVKAVVKLKIDVDYDKEAFNKVIEENIKKAVSVFPKSNLKQNAYGYGGVYGAEDFYFENGEGDYLDMLDVNEERTLEEELKYLEESGMFMDEDGKEVDEKANDHQI
jgi:hypothetical protein